MLPYSRTGSQCLRVVAVAVIAGAAHAHVFVSGADRAGAFPAYDGSGWVAAVYLNIPGPSAESLIAAEAYADGVAPDFTFKTPWIDFPAGSQAFTRDSELDTVGDFLDDYVEDVSDPTKLDEPMSNMLIRFRGLLKIVLEDEVRENRDPAPPIWVEIGTMGYDGYRVSIVQTIYRRPNVNPDNIPWFQFGPEAGGQGLFPIEIAYFNRYDPLGIFEVPAPNAGIEVYSWNGSEKAHPAGEQMIHPEFGQATIIPPRVIYQPEDALKLPPGDFDGDGNIDLHDWQWIPNCFTPDAPPFIYLIGCGDLDFDVDGRVDEFDVSTFNDVATGP